MPSKTKRLNARLVETLTTPGRHADGANLYLNVSATGARSWIFLYRFGGRQREMGLGPLLDVSLARARELAAHHRQTLLAGGDPIEAKAAALAEAARVPTFGAFVVEHHQRIKGKWKNPKDQAQWLSTLTTYGAPIWNVPVDKISTEGVLAVLQPIWSVKPETASRVRGRIEGVLAAAKVKGLRSGENPALWRGHLDQLLTKRKKLSRGHYPALPVDDMAGFMRRLRARPSISARALEFTILTAARTVEARGALWSELDFDREIWTVPPERMKMGREHRVPLSAAALALLRPLHAARSSDYVFPGLKPGRPLSNMAMDRILRLEKLEVTVHGFRSTFRDWVDAETDFPGDLAEAALAHLVGDETERAYRRGDALEKRRRLMEAWASFISGGGSKGKVVTLPARRQA